MLRIEDDKLILKISFLIEYKKKMISIEEKERIVVSYSDFNVEDWGDDIRKIADIK